MGIHILGVSSSPQTNSYFSEGWLNHQPENVGPENLPTLALDMESYGFKSPAWPIEMPRRCPQFDHFRV
jgi:hypothetical protein